MTRIIGGSAGGRRLQTPSGDRTRPTSDRVREALFSAVQSWCGSWDGLRVLDLYAGSGALGLEALSRGARCATFVEADRRTAALIRRNAADLGLHPARVVVGSVAGTLAGGADTSYDLVLADPPYPHPAAEVTADLAALVEHGWLAADALVVVERGSRGPELRWPPGTTPLRQRRYGETTLWYGRAEPAASAGPEIDPPQED